ncbi:MAG: phospholipase D-like domain-containing protein [Desulfovibrionales bacterium]
MHHYPLRIYPIVLSAIVLVCILAVPAGGQDVWEIIEKEGDRTGVYMLEQGQDAFLVREWMVSNARESIDLMTFIWTMDDIGLVFAQGLLRAADRGVRVRLLLDDFGLGDEPLGILLALDAHPDIAVRIYNPKISAGVSLVELVYNFVFQFESFNHRMHNKTMLMDRRAGITGGRNVANQYFHYDPEMKFLDRDVMILGKAAQEMDYNFLQYWNAPLSRPIGELMQERKEQLTRESITDVHTNIHDAARELKTKIPLVREVMQDTEEKFQAILERVRWTTAKFVSDAPDKHAYPELSGGSMVMETITSMLDGAQERITIESPYFVVPDELLRLFSSSMEKGIDVRVITNSLASTDNIPTFSGYRSQRERLLEMGLELREFNPHPAFQLDGYEQDGKRVVLHAKTVVVDGATVFVGTFNIDPRSVNLSTEEGVVIEDPVLAREVEERMEILMQERNSWNPAEMDPDARAGLWRKVKLWFYSLFPLKPYL